MKRARAVLRPLCMLFTPRGRWLVLSAILKVWTTDAVPEPDGNGPGPGADPLPHFSIPLDISKPCDFHVHRMSHTAVLGGNA